MVREKVHKKAKGMDASAGNRSQVRVLINLPLLWLMVRRTQDQSPSVAVVPVAPAAPVTLNDLAMGYPHSAPGPASVPAPAVEVPV